MQTTPTLCHVTWQTTNLRRTKDFLEALFGWRFQPVSDDYLVFRPPSGAWVGLTGVSEIRPGNAFVPHVSVLDTAECAARARQMGAEVTEEGVIPGVGRFADLRDPDGTIFSIIQFKQGTNEA